MALFGEGRGLEIASNPVYIGDIVLGGCVEPIVGEYINPIDTSKLATSFKNYLNVLPKIDDGTVDPHDFNNEWVMAGSDVLHAISPDIWAKYKAILIGQFGMLGVFFDVPNSVEDIDFQAGIAEYLGKHSFQFNKPGKPVLAKVVPFMNPTEVQE